MAKSSMSAMLPDRVSLHEDVVKYLKYVRGGPGEDTAGDDSTSGSTASKATNSSGSDMAVVVVVEERSERR